MSKPSSQNDGQTGGDFFRHGLIQNFPSQSQLQQPQHQQHSLPLQQQNFVNARSNITLKQQPVIQQQTNLASPSIGITQVAQNTAAASALSASQPASQFVHWSNPLMGGAPFMQHQTAQTSEVQQQQFNDFLFNIQAQAAYAAAAATVPSSQVTAANSQQETYSVLRVGNGNFLKIYHCPENAMGHLSGEAAFNPLPHYNQSQSTSFHHANQQGSGASIQQTMQQPHSQSQILGNTNSANCQAFNSYELFSSNTFTQLPTAEMTPLQHPLVTSTKSSALATTDDDSSVDQVIDKEATRVIQNVSNNSNNNNWNCQPVATALYNQGQIDSLGHAFAGAEVPSNSNGNNFTLDNAADVYSDTQKHQQHRSQLNQHQPLAKENVKENLLASSTETPLVTTSILKSEIPRQEAPKKRIVAEVKPMRMTYSDVLSKFNNQNQSVQQNNLNNASITTTSVPPTTQIFTNQRNQQKSMKIDSNYTNSNNLRRGTDDATGARLTSKKSPTHENKENVQQQQVLNNKVNSNQKRSTISVINNNNNSTNTLNTSNNIGPTLNKSGGSNIQRNSNSASKNNTSNNSSSNDNQQSKKQRATKNSDNQNNGVKSNSEQRGTSKVNVNNGANSSASTSNTYNSANNTYARKPSKPLNSGSLSSATGQQRSRYQNNLNASYSYSSTKRSRNNSSYGASTSFNNSSYASGPGGNRNYELAKRILQTWYTYTLMILTWLFYLVYDTFVLGCSILYERLTFAYDSGKIYVKQLCRDLKQNSNKPGIWFKNYCRKFDAKFSKTSKWAFWRKFCKKKQPEVASEAIKTGRLPATGEEAMYQLLNCKGKDAYSILGVPPNSSQEQIRKHYKKIAVLVHPDKNKQAGAEEAFKVLQRAFELIGEPENRLAYDHSLAEALHAEKAWTELHDLLSQLQTKITEAANTIRCSTCGLRHPRKQTDRPHYAARECASCKIRHSAREGDIWAETSMLGLRWKYLALMEGKVYDITEWANCQKGALAHLEPNSHMVQYRIVRGAQQQQPHQQTKQQQAQQQQQPHNTGSQYPGTGGVGGKFKRDTIPPSEASLHEFLDNLYSGQHPQQQQQNTSAYAGSGSSRRRNRRN